MIVIIMIKEIIKIGIEQIVEMGECCSVVEYNMDRIIEIALGIIRAIEMVSGEEIWDQVSIIEGKMTEMGIKEIVEMKIVKEVEVRLEKDSFQIMPEGKTEVVAVDLDQVQELVLMEIG